MRALTLTWVLAARERRGVRRLVGIAAGVAVGVALLLLVIAAHTALGDRTERSTWALPDYTHVSPEFDGTLGDDEVLVAAGGMAGAPGDYFRGNSITRVSIAATPGSTVAVPGIDRAPAPGEYYASPALAKLIDAAPPGELGDRYGTRVGTITEEALLGPDSLLAIVGAEPDRIDTMIGASVRSELTGFRYPNPSYEIIAVVGGIAVLFPVAVLISIVTRLGQAARAERFSTVRLIGAKPGLVAALAGIEASVPALAGALAGVALFLGLRPLAALVPIEGSRFFASDLRVEWWIVALVALGTAVLAALVAYVTALRAGLGPLGGSREQLERRPRALSLIPLALGVLVLVAPAVCVRLGIFLPATDISGIGGFLLVICGLVLAGPYLASVVSRIGARSARGASGLLALSRIARHPRSTFRSVSGLVLALFVVTVFAVGTTSEVLDEVVAVPDSTLAPVDALVGMIGGVAGEDGLISAYGPGDPGREQVLDELTALAETDGVERIVVVAWYDGDEESGIAQAGSAGELESGYVLTAADATALGIEAQGAEAQGAEAWGTGTPGTEVPGSDSVWIDASYFNSFAGDQPVEAHAMSTAEAATASPSLVMVLTDGSQGAIDRARTSLTRSEVPLTMLPATRAESVEAGTTRWAGQYVSLAWLGILIATLISVISLSVSTTAGMIDRKRQLGLLRLGGMPASTLRRMILVETAVPLATVFLLTIVLGFVTAWSLITLLADGRRNVTLPDVSYLGLIGVCCALAAAAILVVFRSVRSELPLTATRFE